MIMKENNINKTIELTSLYDYYKKLLTDKQKKYFELYFFEDLTLHEISLDMSVSRNAVYDSISKTIATLNDLEKNLKLYKKSNIIKEKIEEYQKNKISKEDFISFIEGVV
ncbi:hypothetical protein SAPIS_v1c08110 [Spiroplasma apis B31]|uniref:UPF0122 protein SAPIS_v1c08110 n=2 Tax=Spiroplasma apis TaxID=2137 RepID=V5RKL6_SPIAP|nr:hypothetical protein SAPIS_v1c08110 [Spiroplasma apis B31]